MYFSRGGHESFALEGPLGNCELQFSRSEEFIHLVHDQNGQLTGEKKAFGTGTRLPLPEEELKDGNTLIFQKLRSRSVRLIESGKAVAQISFGGFPNLLLWRASDQNMICIEPWHNLPDGPAHILFPQKEGIIALPPHGKKQFVRTIEYFTQS